MKLEPRLVYLSASGDLDTSIQPFLSELKVKSMIKAKCEGFIDPVCTISHIYVLIFMILII